MEHFEFYCPLCNKKLKVPFVNNGEICNCPSCDGEIVPVFDNEATKQIEEQEREKERARKIREALEQAEREKKAREEQEKAEREKKEEKAKKNSSKSIHCVDIGILNYLKKDTPLITILKILIVLNIIGGIICVAVSIDSNNPYLFSVTIVLAAESVIFYGIIKFLELIQQHFINTFWIKEHLAEISQKLDQ